MAAIVLAAKRRRPGRADIESAPTTVRPTTYNHRRGGFHIRPQIDRFKLVRREGSRPLHGRYPKPRPGRRGRRPLRMIFMGKQKTKVSALAKPPGGVKPPYSTIGKGDVGGDACIAPQVAAHLCGPMTSIGPYSMGAEEFRPRRGQYGERAKSVKKIAALLQFLVFSLTDHNFGVPRGE